MSSTDQHGEHLIRRGLDFDPLGHEASALSSGIIGRAAWGLFERGDGLILSFNIPDHPLVVIPIDSKSEKDGFLVMAADLAAEAEKLR
jgi:hypothetical protein